MTKERKEEIVIEFLSFPFHFVFSFYAGHFSTFATATSQLLPCWPLRGAAYWWPPCAAQPLKSILWLCHKILPRPGSSAIPLRYVTTNNQPHPRNLTNISYWHDIWMLSKGLLTKGMLLRIILNYVLSCWNCCREFDRSLNPFWSTRDLSRTSSPFRVSSFQHRGAKMDPPPATTTCRCVNITVSLLVFVPSTWMTSLGDRPSDRSHLFSSCPSLLLCLLLRRPAFSFLIIVLQSSIESSSYSSSSVT